MVAGGKLQNMGMLEKKINNTIIVYKQMPLPAKASIWFLISTLLNKGMSLITVPVFARIMDQNQYGLYSTYQSVLSVVTVFCTLNFSSCAYINGYVKFATEKEKNELATSLLSLDFILTTVLFFIYFFSKNFFNKLLGLNTPLMYLIFAGIIFTPAVQFWIVREKFRYKYIGAVCVTLAMVLLNAMIGVVVVMNCDMKNQAFMRAFSIVIVQVCFGAFIGLYYWRKSGLFNIAKYWKYGLKLNLPMVPHSLSMDILASADKVMITTMIGSAVTALYSVACSASQIVMAIKLSVVDAMRPWIYEKLKEKNYIAIKHKSSMVMLLMVVLTFVFVAFAPELMILFASKKYEEAIYVIPAIAGSTYFTFVYNMCSIVEIYFEKNTGVAISSVVAAVTNVVLNAIFIPHYGFAAAGYTTLISYIILCAMHFLFTVRVCNEKVGGVAILDMRFILVLSCVVIFFIMIFGKLYDYRLIRYSVILIIILCGSMLGKKYIYVFKELGACGCRNKLE